MKQTKSFKFPKSFLWGASVSAHQVEGGLYNQWTVWELENAQHLAKVAKRDHTHLANWSQIAAQASSPANYVSDKAVNHAKLYKKDFALMKKLGFSAFRFSIEWSKIEPKPGVWDAKAIDFYRQYLKDLKAQGIEPVVSLFHFTLPVWFAEMGGFTKRKNIQHFVTFATRIMDELGSQIKWVITINEPGIYTWASYLNGLWPPQVKSRWQAVKVTNNLISAHNKIAKKLHAAKAKYQVSMAYNFSYVYTGDDSFINKIYAKLYDFFGNRFTALRTMRSNDFIGVNYYNSDRFVGCKIKNLNEKVSDLGWEMKPYDLRYLLERTYRYYKKPILITENGLADANDQHRKWWLDQTMVALSDAQANGVKMLGYLHWSLLDNFEWRDGFWPKFGLIAVDHQTMKRQVRPSALYYAKIIAKLSKR